MSNRDAVDARATELVASPSAQIWVEENKNDVDGRAPEHCGRRVTPAGSWGEGGVKPSRKPGASRAEDKA